MSKVRVAFLGSKEIGAFCLQHILHTQKELNVELVAVLSNNRTLQKGKQSIKQLAGDYKLPWYSHEDDLLQLDFDLLISVQYHAILKESHIQKAKSLACNLHMAPLPEYRGANQFSFAIVDGSPLFGTTLHEMTPGIDAGGILFENRFKIDPNTETAISLYEKTNKASENLFVEHWADLVKGQYTAVSQASFETARSSSFHLKSEIQSLKVVDLTQADEDIDRVVRACWFPPFDPPYALVNGEKKNLSLNWKEELGR